MSSFLRGIQAGVQMGGQIRQGRRQDEIDKREREAYERAEAFRKEYAALREAHVKGTDEFAARVNPDYKPESDDSYDRVTERKGGVGLPVQQPEVQTQVPVAPQMGLRTPQQIETAVGQPTTQPGLMVPAASAEQGPSLSLANPVQQAQRMVPLSAPERDELFYTRAAEIGAKYLDPDKAAIWQQGMDRMRKDKYLDNRNKDFRAAISGDTQALGRLAKLYDLIPNGNKLDVSMARWDPKLGGFVGVMSVDDDGTREAMFLGKDELAEGFAMTEPDKMAAYLAGKRAEGRDERRLAIAETAEARQASAQASAERNADRRFKLDEARFEADLADSAWMKKYRDASLNIDRQRLNLQKAQAEKDENARDLLARQTLFQRAFDPGIKLSDASTEEDRAAVAASKQYAAAATMIYGMSTEGKPGSSRNAIASETQSFILALDAGKVDLKKVEDLGNGTVKYGNLILPRSLLGEAEQPTAVPVEPPRRRTPPPRGLPAEGVPGLPSDIYPAA